VNIEETKKAIEVMQAFVDGKTIECNHSGPWTAVGDPVWDWSLGDYCVKPQEPKEIWVNEYGTEEYCGYGNRGNALAGAANTAKRKAVHYREVIEE
jgi:hypothetical protein